MIGVQSRVNALLVVVTACCLLGVMRSVAARDNAGQATKMVAREVSIVDATGKVRLRISGDGEEPGLRMLDAAGSVRAELVLTPDRGSIMRLRDAQGNVRAQATESSVTLSGPVQAGQNSSIRCAIDDDGLAKFSIVDVARAGHVLGLDRRVEFGTTAQNGAYGILSARYSFRGGRYSANSIDLAVPFDQAPGVRAAGRDGREVWRIPTKAP